MWYIQEVNRKYLEKENLTPSTMLTVKDASRFCNMSVPAFYTDRNKKLLGFDQRKDDNSVWLISVERLIENGFLTSDFEPVRGMANIRTIRSSEKSGDQGQILDDLLKKVSQLEQELQLVSRERDSLKIISEERANQLEMINSLIATMGARTDGRQA